MLKTGRGKGAERVDIDDAQLVDEFDQELKDAEAMEKALLLRYAPDLEADENDLRVAKGLKKSADVMTAFADRAAKD